MKKNLLFGVVFCFMVSLAFAQDVPLADTPAAMPVTAEVMTIIGTVIDNACAGTHKEDLSVFIKTHPKTCALMPACVASGYSIFSEGKLMKFDAASSEKIAEFLKMEESKLDVVVTASMVGEELSLVSIENQK